NAAAFGCDTTASGSNATAFAPKRSAWNYHGPTVPSPFAPSRACAALVVLLGTACASGKGSVLCQGLVCAPELPRRGAEVAAFEADEVWVWKPGTLLVVTGGLVAPRSADLAACRLRLRWTGTREGFTDSGPPETHDPGERGRATWRTEARGFTEDDVLEVR